ncbi:MAG: hypothetical protein M1553_11790 [Firmicutes bacterium]|nr:hypothetical protein [Bacillota bacterium]
MLVWEVEGLAVPRDAPPEAREEADESATFAGEALRMCTSPDAAGGEEGLEPCSLRLIRLRPRAIRKTAAARQ